MPLGQAATEPASRADCGRYFRLCESGSASKSSLASPAAAHCGSSAAVCPRERCCLSRSRLMHEPSDELSMAMSSITDACCTEGDPGEPHDEPSPFPMSSRPSSSPPPSASRSRRDDGGGTGLRDSRGSLRPRTPRDEAWQKAQAAEKQKDEARLEDFQGREREMSEILRLLREKKEREGSGQ